jgi:MFS transporter, DHA1 family, multidrug resistance protein
VPPRRVLAGAGTVALVAAVALGFAQPLGVPAVLGCLWLFVAACGGCFPCAAAIALDGQGEQAGTATSAYGVTTFGAAALVAPLPGVLGVTGAAPVALVLTATAALVVAGAAAVGRAPA